MNTFSFVVPTELSGERLDVTVTRLAPELTRARVQKCITDGQICVDGNNRKANYRVREGEELVVTLPEIKPSTLAPEAMQLDILYEDQDLLVLNKPKGLVVHPAAGHNEGTLVHALLHHCRDLSGIGGEARPGIVHRLDKDTSGVLVIAKNDRAHLELTAQFKVHSVIREYLAVVHGEIPVRQGTVDANIARHPQERKKMAVVPAGKGRRAVTHFQVLEQLSGYTYITVRLETGRTHQIRVHMSSIGYPVVGDPLYGYKKQRFDLNGQALHARLLGFIHPVNGQYMEFASEPPLEFTRLLQEIREQRGDRDAT